MSTPTGSMFNLLNAAKDGVGLDTLSHSADNWDAIDLNDIETAEAAGHLQVVHRTGGVVSAYWALNRAAGQRHELDVQLTPAGRDYLRSAR